MDSILKDDHGVYRWNGVIDKRYEHKTFGIVFGVCGGICIMFVIMGIMLGGGLLGIMLLTAIGVMAVCGAVCWLFNLNAGKRKQGYLMTEVGVSLKQRRSYSPLTFRSIRKAVIYPSRDMIELYQIAGSAPVFVPHDDFDFVKDYILRRLPETAEIVYG